MPGIYEKYEAARKGRNASAGGGIYERYEAARTDRTESGDPAADALPRPAASAAGAAIVDAPPPSQFDALTGDPAMAGHERNRQLARELESTRGMLDRSETDPAGFRRAVHEAAIPESVRNAPQPTREEEVVGTGRTFGPAERSMVDVFSTPARVFVDVPMSIAKLGMRQFTSSTPTLDRLSSLGAEASDFSAAHPPESATEAGVRQGVGALMDAASYVNPLSLPAKAAGVTGRVAAPVINRLVPAGAQGLAQTGATIAGFTAAEELPRVVRGEKTVGEAVRDAAASPVTMGHGVYRSAEEIGPAAGRVITEGATPENVTALGRPVRDVAVLAGLHTLGKLQERGRGFEGPRGRVDSTGETPVQRPGSPLPGGPRPPYIPEGVEPNPKNASAASTVALPESSPSKPSETSRLYRETNIDQAIEILPNSRTQTTSRMKVEPKYFSDRPELALGQGANTGVLLEFAPAFRHERSVGKPGLSMIAEAGGGNEFTSLASPEQLRPHLRSVTVKPDAKGLYSPKFGRYLRGLELEGWTVERGADGSMTWRKPESVAVRAAPGTPNPAVMAGKGQETHGQQEVGRQEAQRGDSQVVERQQQPQDPNVGPRRQTGEQPAEGPVGREVGKEGSTGGTPVPQSQTQRQGNDIRTLSEGAAVREAEPGAATVRTPSEARTSARVPFFQSTSLEGATPQKKLELRAKMIAEGRLGDVVEVPTNVQRVRPLDMTGDAKDIVSAPEIIKTLSELGDVKMRIGLHRRLKKALGFLHIKPHYIAMRTANDIQTAAHEAGHALHNRLMRMKTNIPPDAKAELMQLGAELYGPMNTPDLLTSEGIAEYVAHRTFGENPGGRFPNAHAWFENVFAADPKVKALLDKAQTQFARWDSQGALGRVRAHVHYENGSLIGRVGDRLAEVRRRFRQNWVNEADPLERAEAEVLVKAGKKPDQVPPSKSPSKVYAALKMSASGTARHFVETATVSHDGTPTGPSLVQVLKPIRANLREFTDYAVARRSLDLMARGINPGISERDARHVVEHYRNLPRDGRGRNLGDEFELGLFGVTEWSNRLLDYVQDAGGLSPEARQAIELLNPVYVPFRRHLGDEYAKSEIGTGWGFGDLPTPVKRIKGSGRQLTDPITEFTVQAERLISIANKMRVGRAMVEMAERYPFGAVLAEKIDVPKQASRFTIEQIKQQLEAAGVDLANADLETVLTAFQNGTHYTGKENVVGFWRDGRRQFWRMDPALFRLTKDMDHESLNGFLRVAASAKRAVQLGAVGLNASFGLVRNPIRDAFTWMVFTATGKNATGKLTKTPFHTVEGFWESLRRGEAADRFQAMGGEMATIMGQDRLAARRALERDLIDRPGEAAVYTLKHPVQAAGRAFEGLQRLIGSFEANPRITEFKNIFEQSKSKWGNDLDAAIEAMVAAKDATVNFTRMGVYSRVLNQVIPFFNAKIQSADKFFRTFGPLFTGKGGGRSQAMYATARAFEAITVPSMLLWWMNRDQEWYRRRVRWEKGAYWMMSLDGGKTILRIPKPFELGYVFGSAPEALADHLYHGDESSRRMVNDTLWDTFASLMPVANLPDLIPAIMKPAVEAGTGYSFWQGRPIENMRDESRMPQDRYDEYTTETAKRIGAWLGVSPKKVEHLLSGYTGGLGLNATRAIEDVLGIRVLTREKQPSDLPVAGTLFGRPDGAVRSQPVEDFYEQFQTLRQKANSGRLTADELRRWNASKRLDKGIRARRERIRKSSGLARTRLERDLNEWLYREVTRRRVLEKK